MIELDKVGKSFKSDNGVIDAVAPTTLRIERGAIFGIIAAAGRANRPC